MCPCPRGGCKAGKAVLTAPLASLALLYILKTTGWSCCRQLLGHDLPAPCIACYQQSASITSSTILQLGALLEIA